jgi:hypothetical protein
VYPGARMMEKMDPLWNEEDQQTFYNILLKYHDKIILEVSAHDHVSDLRYHKNDISGLQMKDIQVELEEKFL